jgi:aspartate dehydrogenase
MNPLRIGIAGLGTIGFALAKLLVRETPGLVLAGVASRDTGKAAKNLSSIGQSVPVLPLHELAAQTDVVVECLPPQMLRQVAESVFRHRKDLIVLSTSGFLNNWDLFEEAKHAGSRIIVASGAIGGLDAVRAAKQSGITSAVIRSSKPPSGFRGLPYVVERGISVDNLVAPLRLFEGSVRDGALAFPSSVNVAVAVSLAGIGPDQTRLEIWADPGITRNTHQVTISAEAADFTLTIENKPSADNPRTSSLVPHSVMAALLNRTQSLQFS